MIRGCDNCQAPVEIRTAYAYNRPDGTRVLVPDKEHSDKNCRECGVATLDWIT